MPELPLLVEWQRVTHRMLLALDEALAPIGLTMGEANALACFGGAEAIGLRELVVASGQRPSTLTGVLDRLEQRGLVSRTPHPGDRRALRVELTVEGRRSAKAVIGVYAAVQRRLPAGEDARAVLRSLDQALHA